MLSWAEATFYALISAHFPFCCSTTKDSKRRMRHSKVMERKTLQSSRGGRVGSYNRRGNVSTFSCTHDGNNYSKYSYFAFQNSLYTERTLVRILYERIFIFTFAGQGGLIFLLKNGQTCQAVKLEQTLSWRIYIKRCTPVQCYAFLIRASIIYGRDGMTLKNGVTTP